MLRHSILVVLLLSNSIYADEYVYDSIQTGRYKTLSSVSNHNNDLLGVPVTVTLINGITTVGEAIEHVLHRSGYRLHPNAVRRREMSTLLNFPLPHTHKKFGEMPLYTVLTVLAGDSWSLHRDDVNRFVYFTDKSIDNTLPIETISPDVDWYANSSRLPEASQ